MSLVIASAPNSSIVKADIPYILQNSLLNFLVNAKFCLPTDKGSSVDH